MTENLYQGIPADLPEEVADLLLSTPSFRLNRIVSLGHTSPMQGWYDQEEHEWVVVLKGNGTLAWEDGTTISMYPGDHVFIPAHKKHKVVHTDPHNKTVWLSLCFPDHSNPPVIY